jgi:hypothetical protein
MRAIARQSTTVTRPFAPDEVPSQTATAAGCPMGALERRVIDRIDGTSTIAEITERVERTAVEVSHVIRRLVELGAVVMASAGVDAILDEGWDHPSVTIPPATTPSPESPSE